MSALGAKDSDQCRKVYASSDPADYISRNEDQFSLFGIF